MIHKIINHNTNFAKKEKSSIDTIKGFIPALTKKYSEKQIRDIAIESHIEKYKSI